MYFVNLVIFKNCKKNKKSQRMKNNRNWLFSKNKRKGY